MIGPRLGSPKNTCAIFAQSKAAPFNKQTAPLAETNGAVFLNELFFLATSAPAGFRGGLWYTKTGVNPFFNGVDPLD